MRIVPRETIPEPIPRPAKEAVFLDLFEDETQIANSLPTAGQLEDGLRNKWVRWLFIHLRIHANEVAMALLDCPPEKMQDLRGRVKGLHDALGFPAMLLGEARAREKDEPKKPEVPALLEPDDFPPEVEAEG